MSRPQKYPDSLIESVLTRRKAGELIEDIAKDLGMECKALTKLINRRHGYIRKKHYFGKKDFVLLSAEQKKTINNMYKDGKK